MMRTLFLQTKDEGRKMNEGRKTNASSDDFVFRPSSFVPPARGLVYFDSKKKVSKKPDPGSG
jgi:hypothetical protein